MPWAHAQIADFLFKLAFDNTLPVTERFQGLARKSKRLFEDGSVGCLMAVISIDAAYSVPSLMVQVRSFLDAWAEALAHLFSGHLPTDVAMGIGRQIVADYEGAILMSRIYDDSRCFDRVSERVIEQPKQRG